MNRKRVAVLLGQIEENTQNLFMQGFLEKAFAFNYDVCIFSMYQKSQATALRSIGDSNIFNLVNYDLFDAVVVMSDTIQTPGLSETVDEQIHASFDGPVLVIDKKSRFFPNVMIDHYTPMKKLIDHLIEVHNYKDIVFLNGLKEHPHSVQRLNGYIDSMKSHGLPVSEDKIFYGDYWYDSGAAMADELMKDPSHLPDAIACANDCMAIGVSSALAKHGIEIPEDIAIIGYDSIEDGRMSPVPLTSADIPARECGDYAARFIDASLKGETIPDFVVDAPLFIGGSCGCAYKRSAPNVFRQKWETDLSAASYHSCLNHIMDDLLAQTDFQSYFNTVFQYIYQIRKFNSFHICMNESWNAAELMIGDEALRHGYTKNVYRIVKCGADEDRDNVISFTDRFESAKLLPELMDDRPEPAAYIFTPLHFDDRCFGYAVISYGSEPRVYPEVYQMWLRNIMQGMEALYRQDAMRRLLNQIEATQVRDALTGLYNYKGFLKQASELCDRAVQEGSPILITALDIAKVKEINTTYGRKTGDEAIIQLSKIISDRMSRNDLCCRIGNDEFLIASLAGSNAEMYGQLLAESLLTKCQGFNQQNLNSYQLELSIGSKSGIISNHEALEHLINDAISEKNGYKQALQKQEQAHAGLSKEDWENDNLVASILDNNNLIYHFQPIVSAKTGEIVSYEALMRANIEKRISPPAILQSAERINRLYDIEKATFFNVINYIDSHQQTFENKKVFINSIPGCQLTGEDRDILEERMTPHAGRLVVEFTEETEIGDEQLSELKSNYTRIHIETAIDDYGAGYSNVNNLLRYMPRYVKIDRQLLSDIHENPQKQHFVRDIIEFAHDNDILALAEGVENSKELKEVIRLGADLIQGFYTAKPQAEPLMQIDERIKNEIVQYNQSNLSHHVKRQFTYTGEERISLIQLGLNKYNEILIPKNSQKDSVVLLSGSEGFQSNIVLQIASGFCGTIILDTVSLGGDRGAPCINLGENADVTLLLENDSELRTGGIRVPESSTLTMKGDGNLAISATSGKCYGVGNDFDSRHGRLTFLQDGCLSVHTYGMHGIAIGSGLGGEIHIERGRYELNVNGQEGVCIGAISGDVDICINYCDMDLHFDLAYGVIIGSYFGNASIEMENVSSRFTSAGNCVIGLGTLDGEQCRVLLKNLRISFDMLSNECIGIGSKQGDTDIQIQYATVKVVAQGRYALGLGNYARTAHVRCENSELITQINSNLDSDIGASEDDIYIANGRASFFLNNDAIERNIIVAEL